MQRYYSNIYWHFTGSPKGIDWREVRCPSDISKQGPTLSSEDATNTLKLILDSKKLLASCTERVLKDLETKKFCCVTDIPLKDLPSHSPYYGKVAIGFRASVVHKAFLPVMYVPMNSMPVIEKLVPNRKLTELGFDFFRYSGSFQEQQGQRMLAQAAQMKERVIEPDAEAIKGFWLNFIKVTDFDTNPENTFYREREWRNIGDFQFQQDAVAAIVVPEAQIAEIREHLDSSGYQKSISIVAWEFIENA